MIEFICPGCRGKLIKNPDFLNCSICDAHYNVINGIYDFYTEKKNSPEQEVVGANILLHDALGKTYEEDPLIAQQFSMFSKSRMLEVLKKYLPENGTLIDIGTGTGLTLDIASGIKCDSVGFDISSSMLLAARDKGHNVARSISSNIPLPDECADAVVINSVLHHLFDIGTTIKEAHRLLKPGGVLITDWDPNGNAMKIQKMKLYQLILFLSKYIRHKLSGYKEYYSKEIFEKAEYRRFHEEMNPEELQKAIYKNGFSKCNLIYHSNHESIYDLGFFSQPSISIVRSIILMLMGMTINKKNIYEILMTISLK